MGLNLISLASQQYLHSTVIGRDGFFLLYPTIVAWESWWVDWATGAGWFWDRESQWRFLEKRGCRRQWLTWTATFGFGFFCLNLYLKRGTRVRTCRLTNPRTFRRSSSCSPRTAPGRNFSFDTVPIRSLSPFSRCVCQRWKAHARVYMNFPVGIPCVQTNPQEKIRKIVIMWIKWPSLENFQRIIPHNYCPLHHIQGWSMIRTSVYADDVAIFMASIKEDIHNILRTLQCFGDIIWLRTNLHKSLYLPIRCGGPGLVDILHSMPAMCTSFHISISGCHYLSHNSK
jgi:hypothetical protein